jgi:hypothetical protein
LGTDQDALAVRIASPELFEYARRRAAEGDREAAHLIQRVFD